METNFIVQSWFGSIVKIYLVETHYQMFISVNLKVRSYVMWWQLILRDSMYFTTAVSFQCRSTFYIVVFSSSILAVCTTLTVHTKNIQVILVCSSV